MGFTTVTTIAILAFNALMAIAQVYTCECDGLDLPNWDDCATIASTLNGTRLSYPAGSDQLPCVFLNPPSDTDPDSLDCTITYCKRDGVARGEPISYQDILLWYTSVASNCRSTNKAPGGGCGPRGSVTSNRMVTVNVQANPYYPDGLPHAVVSGTRVWATPPEGKEGKEKREHARDFAQGGLGR
ncbi:hypothetical protein MBLNU13_g04695t1 [Cladosporium sp. NU13]